MRVICSKENLLKGINSVSRAVPTRTTMEILKCVLLQAEDNSLKFTANDTSLGIETTVEAEVSSPGFAAVEASIFSAIVRKLPDSEVIIDTNDQIIHISCENADFKIAGRGTDDFIYLPSVDTNNSVVISQFTVREMVNQVIFSIAESELNAAMSGVFVEVFDGRIRMTTLDGFRISVRVNELKDDSAFVSAIVPGKTLNDVSKILSADSEKKMTVSFSKNHITFEFDTTKVVSRLIDGDYFNIESMLREEYSTHVHINKRSLMECLDRATLFVNESDKKPVIINIEDDSMNLKLRSGIGSMNASLPIQKDGGDIKIAFNPKLLLDALRVIEDEEIDMYLCSYNYPCTIKDKNGSYTYVVLPVNFTED